MLFKNWYDDNDWQLPNKLTCKHLNLISYHFGWYTVAVKDNEFNWSFNKFTVQEQTMFREHCSMLILKYLACSIRSINTLQQQWSWQDHLVMCEMECLNEAFSDLAHLLISATEHRQSTSTHAGLTLLLWVFAQPFGHHEENNLLVITTTRQPASETKCVAFLVTTKSDTMNDTFPPQGGDRQ